MYILPGYTKYYEKDGSLYIFSQLLQNEVKLTTEELKNEFYKLVETGGVSKLSTELTVFLHDQELLLNEKEIQESLTKAKQLLGRAFIDDFANRRM